MRENICIKRLKLCVFQCAKSHIQHVQWHCYKKIYSKPGACTDNRTPGEKPSVNCLLYICCDHNIVCTYEEEQMWKEHVPAKVHSNFTKQYLLQSQFANKTYCLQSTMDTVCILRALQYQNTKLIETCRAG